MADSDLYLLIMVIAIPAEGFHVDYKEIDSVLLNSNTYYNLALRIGDFCFPNSCKSSALVLFV
jgi:hypothetical protein